MIIRCFIAYMFFETLFVQYRETFASFNFFKGRLANVIGPCSACGCFCSIKFSSVFLENTALAAHRFITINYLTIKNSCISFECIGRLINWISVALLSAQVSTSSLCSLLHLLSTTIASLLYYFNFFININMFSSFCI